MKDVNIIWESQNVVAWTPAVADLVGFAPGINPGRLSTAKCQQPRPPRLVRYAVAQQSQTTKLPRVLSAVLKVLVNGNVI